MPQRQLPAFPVGSTLISQDLSCEKRDDQITYFYGTLPIFSHAEKDVDTFKMITA